MIFVLKYHLLYKKLILSLSSLIFFKTIMVSGICLSIQVKVKSENGNLQADVDLKKKAGHESSTNEDGGKTPTIYS